MSDSMMLKAGSVPDGPYLYRDWPAHITVNTPFSCNGSAPVPSPMSTQVGGSHYKDMPIQPAEYIIRNNIGWAEGCAIAYLSRWRQKGGVQDLEKAKHTIELLIAEEAARRD
jgi:hypothetical protein